MGSLSGLENMKKTIKNSAAMVDANYKDLDIYKCFLKSAYWSIKLTSYFRVYTELLDQYRGTPITFVEIGVLNGGSLFMWREYFGENARIIGIDFNPLAKQLEHDGFEIHIGSQSDPLFWAEFFRKVGDVDIILDDGGHKFDQQIITAYECIPHIRDGGLLIIEDTHTSYFKGFGYPTKYSFIEWTKKLIDNINSRYPIVRVSDLPYKDSVFSINFFESIVSFKIQRNWCFESEATTNSGKEIGAEDFRQKDSVVGRTQEISNYFARQLSFLKKFKPVKAGLYSFSAFIMRQIVRAHSKVTARRMKRFF